jgi:hypothetical protein
MGPLLGDARRYDHHYVTPEEHRRRIDDVLDARFLEALETVTPADLRHKLRDARSEEDALSYIRRNLHGRLDLLRAEIERRAQGRGAHREDMGALAAVLTEGSGPTRGTRAGLGLRAAAVAGRRRAEEILSEDHLARLDELDDAALAEAATRTSDAEKQLSVQRQRLHEVIDTLEAELAARYKSGLEPSLERLQ